MDLVEFRDYCLSFGDVTEGTPFGRFAERYDSILVFYVAGHMFCLTDIEDFSYVNVRSTPERMAELRDTCSSVSRPINRSLRYWVRIDFNGDVPDDMIRQLVGEAYGIVKAKYSGKRRG